MDSLEYQRQLAVYDERIAFHKAAQESLEHEKAQFVLRVIEETLKARSQKNDTLQGQPTKIIGPKDAG